MMLKWLDPENVDDTQYYYSVTIQLNVFLAAFPHYIFREVG